jgi:F-box and WD-40 domain protein 1/11
MAVLDELPTAVIVEIVKRLNPRLYIDFIRYLPPEVCLKILGYLDPVSLISVARSCRSWYDLAMDRKLWERLYHMEGWKVIYSEIQYWEEKLNQGVNASINHLHRIQSSEDGHTHKKRAISEDSDNDMEITDEDVKMKDEPEEMNGSSLFAPPAWSFGSSKNTSTPGTLFGDVDMDYSSSKGKGLEISTLVGKGKGRSTSPHPDHDVIKEESLPPMIPSDIPGGVFRSTLWSWDSRTRRYRINWKYLYTMRRRLEFNWELGKYTNFQLPHPNFPEEGHQECIYSLQFSADYLVSGSRDRTLRIWNMRTRRLVRPPLVSHAGSVLCLQFDASPEEDIIVSGSSDSDVILWRFSTGQVMQRLRHAHRESVLNVRFDKNILVTCSKDRTIKVFNRRPLRYGDPGYGEPTELVNPVPVRLRNYYDHSPVNELPVKPPYTMIACMEGHGAAVNAVQICGKEIVSASGDRHIKVWDWTQQVCIRTFPGHSKGIACIQYDGRRVVSGSSDNEVKVFDRITSAEVASLRAHTSLVRTVQAGFGDLPYSVEEDQARARQVDEEFFKAVEDGKIPLNNTAHSSRGRPRNAGSSRPEDITAYGAKLPPGGGGGKYGRIVSGSYDQSIIIWRRDKEGVWKDAHHLRHEEAAAAALRQANAAANPTQTQTQAAPTTSPSSIALHPSIRPSTAALHPSGPQTPPAPSSIITVENPIIATITPQSAASFMSLIDVTVPQGVAALQQALSHYPTILAHHSHLQAAIDREPSPFLRSQLRQAVSAALLRTQYAQNRQRQAALQHATIQYGGGIRATGSAPPATSLPRQSSSHASTTAAPASGLTPSNMSGGSRNIVPAATHSHHQSALGTSPNSATNPQESMTASRNSSASPTVSVNTPEIQNSRHAQPSTQAATPATAPASAQPPAQAQQQPAQQQAQQAAHVGAVPHFINHPHLANPEHNPARVFKLQFDARRIICCSQTSVIVGWDFCNADPELEEASRFFSTIE